MTTPLAPVIGDEAAGAPPSLWRNRSFNLLWGSQVLSDLGTNMSVLAFPLLVLALTNSPITAGLIGTGGALARMILRLPAGVVADRVNRKRAMLICDAVRLVAYAVLGLLVLTHHVNLPIILATAVVDAFATTIFGSAEMAALRSVVPIASLTTAVARNEARNATAALIGPPLGGVLFSVARALPFLADAVSYGLSLIGVSLIRTPLQQERTKAPGNPLTELREGLRFSVSQPFVRAVLMLSPPINLAFNGVIFASIIILRQEGVAPGLIGTVDTILSVGGLLGAFSAGTLQRLFGIRTLIIGISWAGAALIASAALFTHSILIAVPIALAVFLSPATNAAMFGYQAAVTPDELQGRVMSVIFTAALSLQSVAPLLAGVLYAWIGAQGTILVFAGCIVVGAVIAMSSSGIRTARTLSTDPLQPEAAAPEVAGNAP
jgi:MFS family permease